MEQQKRFAPVKRAQQFRQALVSVGIKRVGAGSDMFKETGDSYEDYVNSVLKGDPLSCKGNQTRQISPVC